MRRFIFLLLSCFSWNLMAAQEKEQPPRLRFFNLDLHISVIADVKHIFESLGHEVVTWSISGHTWVFGKERDVVDVVNESTWGNLDKEMCDRFYERYKDFLSQFDGFIVTHTPAFALLYEKFNKPIIVVNSTRYESPFTRNAASWQWLNDYLKNGVKNNRIFIVSNNKGDSSYLRYYTDIESEVIPSLCLYTNREYRGVQNKFYCRALFGDKSFRREWKKVAKKTGLFTKLRDGYSWEDLYNLKGVVHFPYQVSTMSLFEQYSANVPLFFPTKDFLFKLHKSYPNNILCQLSFLSEPDLVSNPLPPEDPNNVLNDAVVQQWIEWADFYDTENMPYIQYFDSFKKLEQLLKKTNHLEISQKMKEHNKKRQAIAFEKWQGILEKVRQAAEAKTGEPALRA